MNTTQNTKNFASFLQNWGLEILLLIWFVIVLIPQGPGITFDSVSFIEIGKHLLESGDYLHTGQNGLEFASDRFPLYTLLIAPFNGHIIGLFICQCLLFMGSVFALRAYLKSVSAPKYFLLFFAFFVFVANYYSIWTESLYGFLMLLCIYQIQKPTGKRIVQYLLILLVLLCLTRLVGIVVGGALALAYLFKKKPKYALYCLSALVLAVGFWVLYGKLIHSAQARFIHYNPITALNWIAMPRSIGNFLVPPSTSNTFQLIIGSLLSILPTLFLIINWSKRKSIRLIEWFLVIHFYAYILFIWICIALIDACIPVEFRTLFPLYINLLALLVVYQTSDLMSDKFKNRLKFVLPKIIILFLVFNIYGTLDLRLRGTGYNSADWDTYKFTEVIQNTQTEVVYTNDQAALNYFSNYSFNLKLLNEKYNLHSLIKNERYAEMHQETIELIQQNPVARIIWVRNGITSDIYPTYEELKSDDRLKVVYDDWLCLILEAAD